MPLRDYTCPNGHHQERLEPVESPSTVPCDCGQTADRGLSAPGFKLTGPGFTNSGRPVASCSSTG